MNIELKVAIKPEDAGYFPIASTIGKKICAQVHNFDGRFYVCTKEQNHEGDHAAHNTRDEIVAIWENSK